MEKPAELVEAEVVEMLCERYHVTPDEARAMDASVLRHLQILALARADTPQGAAAGRAQSSEMDMALAAVSTALAGVGGG